MKKLLFVFFLILFSFLFFASPTKAQVSCAVKDINAGETPVFTASGLEPSQAAWNFVIQVHCADEQTCGKWSQPFCGAFSDANGNMNFALSGKSFDLKGPYAVTLGERRFFTCALGPRIHCQTNFQVLEGGLTPGTCDNRKVGDSCQLKDNCNEGYQPQIRQQRTGGKETITCGLCECVKEGLYGEPGGATGPDVCTPVGGEQNSGIETGLGCIPVGSPTGFVSWFLRWAIGIAGGIAFLLILFAGFQIMTASGNPEKLQAGRELLTAAISGLILIIFSVFLLRLIGVEILQLPGLK